MARGGDHGSRRGGRGGSGGARPREEQISRALSKLLRHQAEKEGLKLGPGGYINVQEVLNNRNLRNLKITLEEVQDIVASNEKQRFKLIPIAEVPTPNGTEATSSSTADVDSTDPSQWFIRANQGHSIKVDEDGLMEPVTLDFKLPDTVVHGTTSKAWPLIIASGGLKKMTRNHVHFASGLPSRFKTLKDVGQSSDEVDNETVISGMRNSSSILIFIDIRKAIESGLKFWRSSNGVILSEGNEEGIILSEYFLRVEDRKNGRIIMEDGELKGEA